MKIRLRLRLMLLLMLALFVFKDTSGAAEVGATEGNSRAGEMAWNADSQQATSITMLAQLGNGTALKSAWHPEYDLVAIVGSQGVWLYEFQESTGFHAVYEQPIIPLVSEQINDPRRVGLAWSPDGSRLAVATRHMLTIFNMPTLQIEAQIALSDYMGILAWSSNSKWLAARNSQTRITTMYLESAETTWSQYDLDLDDAEVIALAWQPASIRLAIATSTSVKLSTWNGTGWIVQENADASVRISDLAWSHDGSRFAGVDSDKLFVWQWQGNELGLAFDYATRSMNQPNNVAVRWNPTDSYLVVATNSGRVYVVDALTATQVNLLEGSQVPGSLNLIEWIGTDEILVIDETISIRDIAADEPADYVFIPLDIDPRLVTIQADLNITGRSLVVIFESTIQTWDISSATLIDECIDFAAPAINLLWGANNEQLFAVGHKGSLDIWNLETGDHDRVQLDLYTEYVEQPIVATDSAGLVLVTIGSLSSSGLRFYDLSQKLLTAQPLNPTSVLELGNSTAESLQMTAAGDWIIVSLSSEAPRVYHFNNDAWTLHHEIEIPSAYLDTAIIRISPTNPQVAVPIFDRSSEKEGVAIWNFETQSVVKVQIVEGRVLDIGWNPDGEEIAITTDLGTRAWNILSDTVRMFPQHTPYRVAWGEYLVLYEHSRNLEFWTVTDESIELVNNLDLDTNAEYVVWNDDNTELAVAGNDGLIRIFTHLEVPAAPTNLEFDQRIAPTNTTAHVKWLDNADNESGFEVEWSFDYGQTWQYYGDVPAHPGTGEVTGVPITLEWVCQAQRIRVRARAYVDTQPGLYSAWAESGAIDVAGCEGGQSAN